MGNDGDNKVNIKINVPDGVSSDWAVQSFEVDGMGASFHNMRETIHGTGRGISAGKYKRLAYKNETVMSNTPAEIDDLYPFIDMVHGRVLINGLGLGVALEAALAKRLARFKDDWPYAVTAVTVIEISEDVIKLVGPTYWMDPRVTIIQEDAFKYRPSRGIRYDTVWHDIWPNLCADNLAGMKILHKKYQRIARWQGSWCSSECLRMRRTRKRGM